MGNISSFALSRDFSPPTQKVKANKIRPYLVANIVELLDIDVDEKDEESAFKDVSLEVSFSKFQIFGKWRLSERFLEKIDYQNFF